MTPHYAVRWTEQGVQALEKIRDRRILRLLLKTGDSLATDPEKKGKPLMGALAGYRSIRAAGQRYRLIYRVEREIITVWIATAGLRREGDRKDVYELARRLLNLGLLKGRG